MKPMEKYIMKTLSITLALPTGDRSRKIHILKSGSGAIHMANSTCNIGTPMMDEEADKVAEMLALAIDGCIVESREWSKPVLTNNR